MSARPTTAREVALQVCRDVFGPNPRGRARSAGLPAAQVAISRRATARSRRSSPTARSRCGGFWTSSSRRTSATARRRCRSRSPRSLRLGTYQLRVMHGVEAYAAVSESVGLARKYGHKGTAGLVNAVLRRVSTGAAARGRLRDARVAADVGGRTTGASGSARTGSGRSSRASTRRRRPGFASTCATVTPDDARARSPRPGSPRRRARSRSTRSCSTRTPRPPTLERLANHRWHLHAEAAAFPVDVLDPQPGMRIVELCCGRGNKTLQIASRMRDDGSVLAVDDDARKVAQIATRLEAAGIGSVALRHRGRRRDAGAARTPTRCCSTRRARAWASWGGSPSRAGARTRTIPSAWRPCSARLLAPPRGCVKPGGALVYAVCSTDRREGEDVVGAFLGGTRRRSRAPRSRRDTRRCSRRSATCSSRRASTGATDFHREARTRFDGRAVTSLNVFARIENACARVVEDAFARVFPSALDPAQIGRRLVATAQASPSDLYLVRVHPSDYARLAGDRDFLEGRWSAMLREAIPRERADAGARRPRRGPRRRLGLAAIEAVVDERAQALALERPDGTRVALTDGLTIGRAEESTLRVRDGRASRSTRASSPTVPAGASRTWARRTARTWTARKCGARGSTAGRSSRSATRPCRVVDAP